MKNNPTKSFTLLAGIALFTSCSTVFTGTKQSINFNSVPSGASVSVNGKSLGVTPLTARVQKKSTATAVFTKDGYADKSIQMPVKFNPVSIINLANPAGWIIDLATGAIHKYENNSVSADLQKK